MHSSWQNWLFDWSIYDSDGNKVCEKSLGNIYVKDSLNTETCCLPAGGDYAFACESYSEAQGNYGWDIDYNDAPDWKNADVAYVLIDNQKYCETDGDMFETKWFYFDGN